MYKKKTSSKKKAFTLVEIMVALFIFVLMTASMTDIFVAMIKRRNQLKAVQQRTEELSLTLNYVAKKIRMSTVQSSGCNGSSCTVKFHASGGTGTFSFDGSGLLQEDGAIVLSHVRGGFFQNATNPPQVTLFIVPINADGSNEEEASVQTSVSVRSY